MLAEADREKWDGRYEGDGYVYGEDPLPLLVEQRHHLPATGTALEVACGEGRNSVYLAQQGFDVLALDISAVGLRKARELAERRGTTIQLKLWDHERSLIPTGPFDVIVCVHYKQRSLCEAIGAALAADGVLLMELHTTDNLTRHAKPSRPHLVEPNELMSWFPQLRLVHYREGWIGEHSVAQLVARKPADG